MATSMYNHHRFARAVMKKFRKAPASLTVELHSNHWRFKGQQGNLDYDGPMRPFLAALREQAIPAALLNTILNATTHVPIYDGCLLIEIHDYRTSCLTPAQELANLASGSDIYHRNPFHKHPPSSGSRTALNSRPAPTSAMGMSGLPCSTSTIHRTGPQTNGTAALHAALQESSEDSSCTKYRVVMKPDSVSMWEQLVHLNHVHGSEGEWDDQSVLQMESRILAAIAPPLALDTSFALSRTANLAMALTAPTLPHMSWDGHYIPRAERYAVHDAGVNAKHVHPKVDPAEGSTKKAATTTPTTMTTEKPSPGGDAAKLGYTPREMDAFARMGAPSVEDLSDRARAAREEKPSSPMSVWNWLSRTYGYHKLRRPGQEPPSNTIFTGQNTRGGGGAVYGDGAAAAMMAIANERANGQAGGEDAAAAAGAGTGTAATKKKPTKKKKKDAVVEDSARGASVVDAKPDEGVDAARSKAKSKKKKDAPAASTATFAAVAPKSKKRGADEMSEAGAQVGAAPPPPPSPSQPPRPAAAAGNTDPSKKSIIAPSTSAPGKKLSKKQQRALEAAEREAARQQAAAAEPPKKKAKKSTFATTVPTAPSSSLALVTPSIPPVGLAEVPPANVPPLDQLGNYDAPVDLSGEDYNHMMVNANLLDPALPPDLAAMPIGEVPENIFMAAAADVDFNFPFAGMGGPEGEMDVASGAAGAGMDLNGLGNPDEANLALAMLQQAQMPDQSRAPPGA